MDDLFFIYLHISLNYLIHKVIDILLRKLTLYSLIQIAVAQLGDNVSIIFSSVNLVESKDV